MIMRDCKDREPKETVAGWWTFRILAVLFFSCVAWFATAFTDWVVL